MAEAEIAFVVVFVHREVHDPAESERILFKKVKTDAKLGADVARLLFNALLFCENRDKSARFQAESFNKSVFAVGNEFRNAACKLALFVKLEPIHVACTVEFCLFDKRVNPLSRLLEVVDGDCLDGLALFKEGRFFRENVRDVLDKKGVAKIGFVRAVISHRVTIGDSAERTLIHFVVCGRELLEHAAEHFFHDGEHVFLRCKAHLGVKLIELARASVRTRVFISETRRDLEILVKTACHEQLFVLLRSLRERIEVSGIKP